MQPVELTVEEPLADSQVKGNAGGYVWKVDDLNRLRRFIVLGSEGGTYYTSAQKLGLENIQCLERLIASGKAKETVAVLTEYSVEGRAAKQDAIILCLAYCARHSTCGQAKKLAYEQLSAICRIPTHLFTFLEHAEKLSVGSGWGRAHRRAVSNWYNGFSDNPLRLAQHVTKYRSRNGWSHRDVLRLAHLKPKNDGVGAVVRYVVKGLEESKQMFGHAPDLGKVFALLKAVEDAKIAKEASEIVALINENHLVREHIPTTFLNNANVWRALLQKMPMTAMIRNLGKMSNIKLLDMGSDESDLVCSKLRNEEALKAARIHPFNVLVAMETYRKGRGDKGSLSWEVNSDIIQALDDAFYKSFKYVEPTGKRYCLAVDVSGSMSFSGGCIGCSVISPSIGAAAMSMVTMKTEQAATCVAFSHNLVEVPQVSNASTLPDVVEIFSGIPMGGTDCSLPMQWAAKNEKEFDVFIVYTDSETWYPSVHPAEALRVYRHTMKRFDAKLIVCGMTSDGFTIADPEDPGMLDMVGFDSAAPQVISDFTLGKV